MQRTTKELSPRGAVISEVTPFLEILKTELGGESSDTQEKFKGILSTKDELLESLNSWFNHVDKEHKYIIAIYLVRPKVQRLFKEHQVAQSCEPQLQTSEYVYWNSLVLQTQVTHPQRRKDSIFTIPIKRQLKNYQFSFKFHFCSQH